MVELDVVLLRVRSVALDVRPISSPAACSRWDRRESSGTGSGGGRAEHPEGSSLFPTSKDMGGVPTVRSPLPTSSPLRLIALNASIAYGS